MPQSPNSGFKLYFPRAPTAEETTTVDPVEHARPASPPMDGNAISDAQRQLKAEGGEQCGWRPDSPEQEHDDIADRCAEIHRTPRPEVCSWKGDPPEQDVDDIESRCERAQMPKLPDERCDWPGDRPDSEEDELGRICPPTQQDPSPKAQETLLFGKSLDPRDEIASPEPKLPKSPLLESMLGDGDRRKSAPEVPQIVIPAPQVPDSAPGSPPNEAKPIPGSSQDAETTGGEYHAEESFQDILNRGIKQTIGAVLEKMKTPTPPPAHEQPDEPDPQPQPLPGPSHSHHEPTTHVHLPPQLSQPDSESIPNIPAQEPPPDEPQKGGKSKKDKTIEKEERAKAKKAKEDAKKERAKAEKERKAKDKKERERLRLERHEAKKERKEKKHREKEKKKKKGKASESTPPEPSHNHTTSSTSVSAAPHPRCEMCQNNEEKTNFDPIKDLMNNWQNLPSFAELADAAKKLIGRKNSTVTTDAPAAEGEEHGHDPELVEHVVDHIAEHLHQLLDNNNNQTAATHRHACGKLAIPGKEHTCGKQCSPASHGLDGNRDSPTPAGGSQIIRSSPEVSVMRSPVEIRSAPAAGTPIDRAMSPWNQRLGLKTSPPYSSHIRSPMRGLDWGSFRASPLTPYPQGYSREAAYHHHFCVPVMPMISSLCLETRCPYDPTAPSARFLGSDADLGGGATPTVSVMPPGLAETLPSHSPPRTPSPNGSSPTLGNASEFGSDTPTRAVIGRYGSYF